MPLKVAILSDSTMDLVQKYVDERVDVDIEWCEANDAEVTFSNGNLGPIQRMVFLHSPNSVRGKYFCGSQPYQEGLSVAAVYTEKYLSERMSEDDIFDPRFWYTAKMRYSPDAQRHLADLYARCINAYLGRRKKVLVVDLDGTLWGGVVGEYGPTGIGLSDDGPDLAFQDTQREIKRYKDEGVILAICSKNDEDVALQAIDEHPCMVLRRDDFAAWRINWNDKPSNLRELAEELNVGLDSFVFLDNDVHERNRMHVELPEVTVPILPDDPSYFPRTISRLPYFDTLNLTDEDRNRPDMYVAERKRRESREALSPEEYLQSLNVRVTVRKATKYDCKRIEQLSDRTNQFNATGASWKTERDPSNWVVCETDDKYGEYGLVGAARVIGETVVGLYISCRALGRGVETAFLCGLCDIAHVPPSTLKVKYVPTKKNGAFRKFAESNGRVTTSGDPLMWYPTPERPEWVTLEVG